MNKFSGTLNYADGTPVPDAKVILSVENSTITKSTKTDVNGKWVIDLNTQVDPKKVQILFSKSGFKSRKVIGPTPTAFLEGFIDPDSGGTLGLQGLFPSGKYKVTSLDPKDKDILDRELEDLFQFIKKNPQNVKIKIRSSESQVPNNDNEGTGKDFRVLGSLAKERGLTLEKYINDELNRKIDADSGLQNKDNFRPIFRYTEADISRVGITKWAGDDPNQEKYKKDQFVAVDVELIELPKDCVSNLIIDIAYIGSGHSCNSTLFKIYGNGEPLNRDDGYEYVSLNNDTPTQEKILENNKLYSTASKNNLINENGESKNPNNTYVREIIYNKKIYAADNAIAGYNLLSSTLVKSGDTVGSRFQDYKVGDVMNLYITENPKVGRNGGFRYNRIQITSDVAKKIKKGDSPIVSLEMECVNPFNVKRLETIPPGGTQEVYISEGEKKFYQTDGCHKGTAFIRIYKLDYQNRITWIYKFTEFNSPEFKNEKIKIFDFNTCTGEITNRNDAAFENLKKE